MNILFLVHRVPYPPNKGDKIRSFNELKHLARRHRVFLGTTLDRAADEAELDHLRPHCEEVFAVRFHRRLRLVANMLSRRPFSVAAFHHLALQRWVDRTLLCRPIDAVLCFCSPMAEYVFRTPRYEDGVLGGVRLVMDYVDLDSDKWRQYARYSSPPLRWLYDLEHSRLFAYEKRINRRFDHSVFVSGREEAAFRRLYPPARQIAVIPNGVDYGYFHAAEAPRRPGPPRLVFTGVMDYFANEDGVTWFCREILPGVRREVPDAEFFIVGARPTKAVQDLGRLPGVTVTGFVEDIREHYWAADVCVTPLRIARGLQNKVLEAMAAGRAVVATSNATDGISCRDGEDVVIANDPRRFAEAVIGLLRDPARRAALGARAVERVRKDYDWDDNLSRLDELLS